MWEEEERQDKEEHWGGGRHLSHGDAGHAVGSHGDEVGKIC